MKSGQVKKAIRQFIRTTTLHGFKYFTTSNQADSITWMACCLVSASCAGALCAALWARFLQTPALLVLRDVHLAAQPRPLVAFCVPAPSLARIFVNKLKVDKETESSLTNALTLVLERKTAPDSKLMKIEQLLNRNNVTLSEAVLSFTPPCERLNKKCKWHKKFVPCEELFRKEKTPKGVCCVMRPQSLMKSNEKLSPILHSNFQVTLVLECSYGDSTLYGCEYFAKYEAEDWLDSIYLQPGKYYRSLLTFELMDVQETDKVVDWTCASDIEYSSKQCVDRCSEYSCGCSDPLRALDDSETLPPCSVTNLNCLRTASKLKNASCNCLPPCKQLKSNCFEDNSPIILNSFYTFDPIFKNISSTYTTVLDLRVSIIGSKMLLRRPTETWFTLLSSLGGIFNMFLGVGLFSALEILFFLVVKLPIALRKSSERNHNSSNKIILVKYVYDRKTNKDYCNYTCVLRP